MMKKWVVLVMVFCFAVSLSGCASARKQKDLEIQSLRNQITVLETQLRSRDEEIDSLKESLTRHEQERATQITAKKSSGKKVVGAVKSRPKARHIQTALRNAGFDPGPIDGKMGRKTQDALRAFQRAHNLSVTGKADKATWNLLRGYLYQKMK